MTFFVGRQSQLVHLCKVFLCDSERPLLADLERARRIGDVSALDQHSLEDGDVLRRVRRPLGELKCAVQFRCGR